MENKAAKQRTQIHTKHVPFRIITTIAILTAALLACKISGGGGGTGGGDCDNLDTRAKAACMMPTNQILESQRLTQAADLNQQFDAPIETAIAQPTPTIVMVPSGP